MTNLLIKNFLRSKGLILGLIFLFLSGLVSLHIGKIFLDRQATTEEKTAEFQEENLQRHLQHTEGDFGLLMYYIRFSLVNKTTPLAGLAIGHRDIHPSVQSINIRNLEEQKYTSELVNPLYQLLGNMDFSFVLIYLFPLIIITFCFNLLSEEKEEGTWPLVLSQTENPIHLVKVKLWIRLASIFIVFFLLLLSAKFYLEIPLDMALIHFALISSLYLIFWFALLWFVISLEYSSQKNAMILLFTWLSLTIIIPASINGLIVNVFPVPEVYSTILDSREGYHDKWDQPKGPTIQKFKDQYPQYSTYTHPEDQKFSWFWYFAMQQMGDNEAALASDIMKSKLQQRDKFSHFVGYLFPSIHTQFVLNRVGRSDLGNYLNFLSHLEAFHEEKRLYFYPKIFENMSSETEQWDKFGLEYFNDRRTFNWLELLPLVLVIFFLHFGTIMKWDAKNRRPSAR